MHISSLVLLSITTVTYSCEHVTRGVWTDLSARCRRATPDSQASRGHRRRSSTTLSVGLPADRLLASHRDLSTIRLRIYGQEYLASGISLYPGAGERQAAGGGERAPGPLSFRDV